MTGYGGGGVSTHMGVGGAYRNGQPQSTHAICSTCVSVYGGGVVVCVFGP